MDTLFQLLAASLFYGTLFALLAWALSSWLKTRAAPGAIAALWTLALLKFLIPVGPPLPRALDGALKQVVPGAVFSLGDVSAHAAARAGSTGLDWKSAVVLAWLAGALVFSLRALAKRLQLHRELRALPEAPPAILEVVERHAHMLKLRAPRTRIGGGGPFVAGLFRPLLVLPLGAAGAQLDAMVLHELAHLRRRDPLVRALQLAASILFFFWPPLRLVNRKLEEAREQACDAVAVKLSPLDRGAYARLLLELQQLAAGSPRTALAMAAHVSQLEGRIDMILESKARRTGVWTLALVIAFGLAAVSAGACGGRQSSRDAAAEQQRKEGTLKVQAGDLDGAVAKFRACIDEDPSKEILATCYRNLAVVQIRQGDGVAAVAALKKYLPEANPAERAQVQALIAKYGG